MATTANKRDVEKHVGLDDSVIVKEPIRGDAGEVYLDSGELKVHQAREKFRFLAWLRGLETAME